MLKGDQRSLEAEGNLLAKKNAVEFGVFFPRRVVNGTHTYEPQSELVGLTKRDNNKVR